MKPIIITLLVLSVPMAVISYVDPLPGIWLLASTAMLAIMAARHNMRGNK